MFAEPVHHLHRTLRDRDSYGPTGTDTGEATDLSERDDFIATAGLTRQSRVAAIGGALLAAMLEKRRLTADRFRVPSSNTIVVELASVVSLAASVCGRLLAHGPTDESGATPLLERTHTEKGSLQCSCDMGGQKVFCLRSFLVTLALVTTLVPLAAASATEVADVKEVAPLVVYDHQDLLSDTRVVQVRGDRVGVMGCSFSVPELSLEPWQNAIEARQLWTDYAVCTTAVEIGIPADIDVALPEGSTSSVVSSKSAGQQQAPLAGATNSKGYYNLYWHDPVNIQVNQSKMVVTWTWNGSTVTYPGGSSIWTWLSATGWSKVSSSSSQVTYPNSYTKLTGTAHFKNTDFPLCLGTVHTYHNGVYAKGTKTGGLSGGYTNTYTTYPLVCPTLHFHTQLVRVYG